MREAVRFAVHTAAFCIQVNCPRLRHCELGGATDFVDCCQADCDNHKRGTGPALTPCPPPAFALPPGPPREELP